MMEQSTHEEDGSWDLRRHRERERQRERERETERERRGEAVSLTITLTLEYSRGQAAARTDAARRLNIKYERNIFPFFCCEWNHRGGCRHTRTHFT